MTTVVYHHESKKVSVDSRVCAGNMIASDEFNKTIKLDGSLMFYSGTVDHAEGLAQAIEGVGAVRDFDAAGLLVSDSGKIHYVGVSNKEIYMQEISYNFAFGTGGEFAIAAMDFGSDSVEAVRYASKRDSLTGGAIRTYSILSDSIAINKC